MNRSRKLLLLGVALIVVGGIAYRWQRDGSEPAVVAGMVRRTEIRIAPEINGRLQRVLALPGQHVEKGALLAAIDNPDVAAAVGEAEAALANARADRNNVFSGVRAEQVDIAEGAVRTAEATVTLAGQQNARVVALAARGFNSQAQLDESNAAQAKAKADLDLKNAQWEQAKAGPTREERALAEAKVALAVATLADLRARLDKVQLVAPVAGKVGNVVAEIGEVITPGKPVMTFVPDEPPWLAFTIREDMLIGLGIGSQVRLRMANNAKIDTRLTELRPLGEFATWRAARAVGDHDLNSFRVRFDQTVATTGIEPGMIAFLTPSAQRNR